MAKVAYVTGGMGGIGTAICQRLHRDGFTVIAGCGPSRDWKKWLDEQKALELRYQAELAAAGALPSQTPQETHLRELSGLAAQNHLSVVRQLPLSPREYPGVLEQRFAYEVTGTMPDLARFFKAVELSPSWTDISYLKMDQGKGTENTTGRNALLTFSAFSMAISQPTATSQGG